MKQVTILNGKAMIVELPEGAHSPVVDDYLLGFNLPAPKWAGDWGDDSYDTIQLPPGNWRIIGMLSEVTDDDLTDVIDVLVSSESGKNLYPNLTGGPWKVSRIQSLESAIEAERYLLKSPPDPKCGCSGPAEEGVCDACDEWMTAQSRVLDRSRCLLLGREGV